MKFRFSPHIAFGVKNYTAAVEFYTEVIGMEILRAGDDQTDLGFGPITFYAERGDDQTVFFEFVTDDLEAATEALEKAGCRLESAMTPERAHSYFVYDPFGLVFHLWQDDFAS